MITLCRTTGMAGVIASSVLVGACAVTIKPIAAPVTALAWDVGPASYDEVVTTATSLAPDYIQLSDP